MITHITNSFIYSSIFVAIISSFLSTLPLHFLNNDIEINKICLIFFGTLFVYNFDHIIDIKSDRTTNPGRTRFISNNREILKLITVISGFISSCIFIIYHSAENFILIPALIFGVFHWKFKTKRVMSALYITLSWVLVVVIFPLAQDFELNKDTLFIISILGLTFLGNALVFMADDMNPAKKLKTVHYSKIIVFIALIFSVTSPASLKYLVFIPALTLLGLVFYREDERYHLLYLDGALLAGGILCLLAEQIIIHLSR